MKNCCSEIEFTTKNKSHKMHSQKKSAFKVSFSGTIEEFKLLVTQFYYNRINHVEQITLRH